MEILLSFLHVNVLICQNKYLFSSHFSSPRGFYYLLVVKLWNTMVDKSVLQM